MFKKPLRERGCKLLDLQPLFFMAAVFEKQMFMGIRSQAHERIFWTITYVIK